MAKEIEVEGFNDFEPVEIYYHDMDKNREFEQSLVVFTGTEIAYKFEPEPKDRNHFLEYDINFPEEKRGKTVYKEGLIVRFNDMPKDADGKILGEKITKAIETNETFLQAFADLRANYIELAKGLVESDEKFMTMNDFIKNEKVLQDCLETVRDSFMKERNQNRTKDVVKTKERSVLKQPVQKKNVKTEEHSL